LSGNVNPLFTLTLRLQNPRRQLRPKEKPRLAAGPSSTHASPELAIGILLLLAGLLPTALLLTWLLTGGLILLPWVLVLLARILVLIAHSGSPC
jgi:fatty acid desaturase